MPIIRTATEIERLRNKIIAHIKKYLPNIKVIFMDDDYEGFPSFTVGYFDAKKNRLAINEHILITWPEEDILDAVNHEMAHAFSMPEYKELLKERYGITSFNDLPKIPSVRNDFHDAIWQRWARIMGARPRAEIEESEAEKYGPEVRQYKMRCATCGYTFYTTGKTKIRTYYTQIPAKTRVNKPNTVVIFAGEDVNHARTGHDVFYVEDLITRARGKIDRFMGGELRSY